MKEYIIKFDHHEWYLLRKYVQNELQHAKWELQSWKNAKEFMLSYGYEKQRYLERERKLQEKIVEILELQTKMLDSVLAFHTDIQEGRLVVKPLKNK